MNNRYKDIITAIKKILDSLFNPLIKLYVKWLSGATVSTGARFNGMPVIIVRSGGRLTIGKHFTANSSRISNPIGIQHPVYVSVVGEEARIRIGDGVGISGATINCRNSICIGNNVLIGSGAAIWDNDFHSLNPDVRRKSPSAEIESRPIVIEDDVFIGARAIILKGVTIGRGSVVGAGAVVAKSVPSNSVAYGNPVQIRSRE